MIDTIGIHRGRHSTSVELSKSITKIDYNFDFRGFHGGSKLNPFWLLLKAWITSKEIPEAKNYLIEGGMLFWVGFFLKRRYPNCKLFVIVPEPAFYFDARKSFIQKLFFKFRMAMMKKTVNHFFVISKMVANDAKKWLGDDISYSTLRYYINRFDRFVYTDNSKKEDNLLFVIERPNDTGYVKGLAQAIKIFEKVQEKMPNIKLLLAGSGTEYLKYDNKNIIGLGYCDIEEVYAKVKISILPARYDAFPMTVPEASLSGVVPIVSNNVGSQELLPDELVLDYEDIEKWASKIQNIFKYSQEEIDKLLSESNEKFKLLTKDRIISSFNKEYKELTKK
jgi:glycosyltransferase involved in cell wall biosynthesis